MTNSLGPEARAIIRDAQGGEGPDDREQANNRRALFARIGGGAGIVATGATLTSHAGGAVAVTSLTTLSLGAKVTVVAACLGLIGAGAYTARQAIHHVRSAPAATIAGSPASATRAASVLPVATPPGPKNASEESPARALAPVPPPTSTSAHVPSTPADPRPPLRPSSAVLSPSPSLPGPLGPELALLQDAQAALREGDNLRALALLDEHAARYPRGALAEERAGARAMALCALRRTDARPEAARFVADRPTSPLAARVRSACGLD